MIRQFIFLLISIGLFAAPTHAASQCSSLYLFKTSWQQKKMLSWRTSPNKKEATDYMVLTLANQSGGISKTSAQRERSIKDYSLTVKKEVLIKDIQAIGMDFFPEIGQSISYLEYSGDYGSHKTPLIQASNLGPEGILRGTLALPVSGRFGRETTLKWATTDLYSVYYRDSSGQQKSLIDHALSQNVVTAQEIEIPLVKGQVIEILYDRHGSAGPYGFPEGRILRITWDGT